MLKLEGKSKRDTSKPTHWTATVVLHKNKSAPFVLDSGSVWANQRLWRPVLFTKCLEFTPLTGSWPRLMGVVVLRPDCHSNWWTEHGFWEITETLQPRLTSTWLCDYLSECCYFRCNHRECVLLWRRTISLCFCSSRIHVSHIWLIKQNSNTSVVAIQIRDLENIKIVSRLWCLSWFTGIRGQ